MLFASSAAVLELFGAIGLFRRSEFGSASCPGFWVLDVSRCSSGSWLWLLLRIISVLIALPPGACIRHLCIRCISCEPFVTLIYNIERLA